MPGMPPSIHIAIMHDRRRAERLPRLLGWLGVTELGVNAGCTIGDGTRRGPWAAMKWCICDFLQSGREWMLLLEDDAEPTEGAVVHSGGGSGFQPDRDDDGLKVRPTEDRDDDGRNVRPTGGAGYWNIREACAELAGLFKMRSDYICHKHPVVYLGSTGGAAGREMKRYGKAFELAPLYEAEPVGTVAVLMNRDAATRFREWWQDWDHDRAFEKTYQMTPDAGDARLWEWWKLRNCTCSRFITTRSLIEHGCARKRESLADQHHRHGMRRPVARRMYNPIEGITPLEWVRSFRNPSPGEAPPSPSRGEGADSGFQSGRAAGHCESELSSGKESR